MFSLRLAGRERELATLHAALEAAARREGAAIVVEGHAGLGKTALLRAAATRAAQRHGMRVSLFACDELEHELPWSAAEGLLAGLLDGMRAAERRGIADRQGHGAVDPHGWGAVDPDVRRLRDVVAALAESSPVALLLDDAQSCDEQSLRFLRYLQRRVSRTPVALIVARRPALDADRLPLDRIFEPAMRVLRLTELDQDAVAMLVRDVVPAASESFCRDGWRASAGNPLYLHELLAEIHAREHTQPPKSVDTLAVPSIASFVIQRLRRLSPGGAVPFAQAASILRDGAPLRQVAALANFDDRHAAQLADALAEADILAPGEPMRFIHPLVRAALQSSIPASRRARLHERCAQLLADEHASPELIASHLLHAPRRASEVTVRALLVAARCSSERGQPGEAIACLRRALEEPPVADDREDVLLRLAEVEAATGDPAAIEHLRTALELVDDPRRRAEILLRLGWVEHHAARFGEAAAAFERGRDAAASFEGGHHAAPSFEGGHDAADDSDLAACLEAGFVASAIFDLRRSADAHTRIRAIERRPLSRNAPAQRALLATVLLSRAMAAHPAERVHELAIGLWDEGRLLEEEGSASQTLWHVVSALSWTDDYETALLASERALRDAMRRGSTLDAARAHHASASPLYWTGRLDEAAGAAREAIEVWHRGLQTYMPAAVYWLVRSLLELDREQDAAAALALVGADDRWEGNAFGALVHAAKGHLAAHRGDAELALEHHLACGRLAEQIQVVNPAIVPWRSEAALAASRLERHETAAELASSELELARRCGQRALGGALRAAGLVHGRETSIGYLQEAVETLERCGARLDRGRAEVDLGAALRRSHRRAAARPHLRRGLSIAERSGATALAQRARTELRAAGGRASGSRSGSAPTGARPTLTPSEQRVATLAADGRTNRQIAAELSVTVKAVEWHLHQTYRKLGIRSRHQLNGVLHVA